MCGVLWRSIKAFCKFKHRWKEFSTLGALPQEMNESIGPEGGNVTACPAPSSGGDSKNIT
ncbi:hypothetical protein E2C01_012031 [Portunus trituberculatus]|uniref:Uncharacterized protein n=1 Tax=Portunus trituberculatus TaxID=210409 RepID=A0A5B7DCY3_PORTR|nr:hypothetical protein [Portunus trituberculatus]